MELGGCGRGVAFGDIELISLHKSSRFGLSARVAHLVDEDSDVLHARPDHLGAGFAVVLGRSAAGATAMGSSGVEWDVSCVHVASGAASTPAREPWCVTLSAAVCCRCCCRRHHRANGAGASAVTTRRARCAQGASTGSDVRPCGAPHCAPDGCRETQRLHKTT